MKKRCPRCKLEMVIDSFPRNRSKKSGYGCWCKKCENESSKKYQSENKEKCKEAWARYRIKHREKRLEYCREYRKNNPEKFKEYDKIGNQKKRQKLYGISPEQFDTLLENQGDRCIVCSTNSPGKKGWCVDHCHETGRIRGILCGKCNMGIGLFDDSTEILKKVISYLESN